MLNILIFLSLCRLDKRALLEGIPYIGTTSISMIRFGISFTLVCEVSHIPLPLLYNVKYHSDLNLLLNIIVIIIIIIVVIVLKLEIV